MEPSKAMISLHALKVGYKSSGTGNGIVYGPVTADIGGPEMVGIIGRNGIGKSTLLRTISGIQKPVSGSVCFRGTEGSAMGRMEMARLVSFVSTEAVAVQHLRVMELVTLGRYPHMSRFSRLSVSDHRIIHDAMEHTGIYALRHAGLHELSDGERQKVMIARALAQDTPVMILDEPTAFLDLPARHEILRLLSDLSQKKSKVILFSTHDLSIAMHEADKLWLLSEQGLLEGSPEDLLIHGGFRTLFHDSDLRFDPGSMTFSFDKIRRGSVSVKAEGDLFIYTCKAMERIGIVNVPEGQAVLQIRVEVEEGQPRWIVSGNGPETSFGSLYALTSHLYLIT